MQGDRSTGGTKPATLETGAEIQVPLFVSTGEKVKVDTRDGRYLGRVSCLSRLARWRHAARRANARWTCSTKPTSATTTPLPRLPTGSARADPPVNDVHGRAGEGVREHHARIDEILGAIRRGLDDRAHARRGSRRAAPGHLRTAVAPDVPDAVAIDEAVELAKTLSTDESPRFVNGVLARVLRDRDRLVAGSPTG